MNHLDYIRNCDGPRTPYVNGYWATDISKLGNKFGTADDLKALSKALHDQKMLLMVDIAINRGAPPAVYV